MAFSDGTQVNEATIYKKTPKNINQHDVEEIGTFLSDMDPEKLSSKFLKHCAWLYWGQSLKRNHGVSYDTDVQLILNELNQRSSKKTFWISVGISIVATLISVIGTIFSYQAILSAEDSSNVATKYLDQFKLTTEAQVEGDNKIINSLNGIDIELKSINQKLQKKK